MAETPEIDENLNLIAQGNTSQRETVEEMRVETFANLGLRQKMVKMMCKLVSIWQETKRLIKDLLSIFE